MRPDSKYALTLLTVAFTLAPHAQAGTTAEELGTDCLVTCQSVNGQSTLMNELGNTDRCIGYLKAVAGGIEWFNGENSSKIDTGSCTEKILANRTATRPEDDEALVQACALGTWISARPAISNRSAAQTVISWMKVTRCE